ncbi:MAG: hypothetical protein ACI31S_03885 [Bacilli bacterium]
MNNRQEDLTKVFDRTWNANHNDVAKRGREREKAFVDKMFNVKNKKEEGRVETPEMKSQNLQKNINGAADFQRRTQINDILKKWK